MSEELSGGLSSRTKRGKEDDMTLGDLSPNHDPTIIVLRRENVDQKRDHG